MKKTTRKNQRSSSRKSEPLHMVGVMLSDSYIDKLKLLLIHHKRTCRGQIMAWIDEETRIIAKEVQV